MREKRLVCCKKEEGNRREELTEKAHTRIKTKMQGMARRKTSRVKVAIQ